jgi:uncharacterized membrane protein YfcA
VREQRESEINPLHLRIAAIMASAAGVGLALLSWFIAHVQPRALYPLLGVGVLLVCVGAGLYLASRAVDRHQGLQAPRTPARG